MSLKVLQAGVAALSRWRDRLAEPDYFEELCRRCEEAERRIAEEAPTGRPADRYHWFLYDDGGQEDRYRWWFRAEYIATVKPQKRDIRISWIFQRLDGDGEAFVVEGTGLSLADEVVQSFRDRLWDEKETGELYVRLGSLPLRFGAMVHMPRRARRLLAPYVGPLIISSNEMGDDEVLAQLCVYALRSDLLHDKGEILAGLERWLARLAPGHREIVSEAANVVILNWSRPLSGRSFRDYCHRTVNGLVNDRRNADLAQQQIARELAGRVADYQEKMSVDEFVQLSGVPKSTAYRWLQEGRITGKVTQDRTTSVTTLGLTVRKTHRRYEVSKAAVGESEDLQRQRDIRRDLMEFLVESRNITSRAARAWVQRRLQKGLSLEQAVKEAMGHR
jgi:hypothetical protein